MYLFSSATVEFFRTIYSPEDVPKRFSAAIIQHSSMTLHGDKRKTVFLQRLYAGLFDVFEHRVRISSPIDVLPTPLTPSIHLHISLDDNDVAAYVNGKDSVALKSGEINLFYLEQINIAKLPEGNHCFFHLSFKNETLLQLLKSKQYKGMLSWFQQKITEVQKAKGGKINNDPVALDAYAMMLIQDIRYSRFNKVVTTYYRQKKCMLLLEHFLSLMINSEPEKNKLELTSQQVITLDYIKEFIKQHIHQKLTVKILRKQFHVNSNLLEKGFRQINMISVEDFIHLWRMESATKYLAHTDMAMNKIPQLTGFRSYTDFVTAFKQYFNCEPELFRYPAHQQ